MTSTRLLKIILVVLLCITAAELGYYFFISRSTYFQPDNAAKTAGQQPQAIPSDQAFTENYLDSLRKQKKDLLVSAVNIFKYKGKIVEIDINGTDKSTKFNYAINVRIQGEQGNTKRILYTSAIIKLAKLTKNVNGKEEKLDLNELKVGDIISITDTHDVFLACKNDECIKALSIEKL